MITKLKYSGTTPGADTNTYNLFSTVSKEGIGRNFFASVGVEKFLVFIKMDATETGTLKEYCSEDGGTTWLQVSETDVTGAAATSQNPYEFLVAPYRDWKLDWVNGGTAQTVWEVNMALDTDRSASS